MEVAIIGTAGRDKERTYDLDLWIAMFEDASKRFSVDKEYTLVSGGAAWADHLAVALFLARPEQFKLKLFLPSSLSLETFRFIGPENSSASAANFYHDKFTEATGILGRREIAQVSGMPNVEISCEPSRAGYSGMFARNRKVALECDAVLAYTWGTGTEPDDGGTKNTWDQVTGRKVHVSLTKLIKEKV